MTGAALWAQRRAQLGTVVRLELGKSLLSRRSLWVYLLALGPVLTVGAHALQAMLGMEENDSLAEDTEILAGIFQIYYLRVGIFFGCLGIFTRLFRGEMMERSAHYYLLAPVRREVLAIGKFLAGAITSIVAFSGGVIACFVLMYVHFGPEGRAFVFDNGGLGHLGAYLGVTVLGCLGYGALFLLLGLLFRNPVLPAISVTLWESMNHVLPAALKFLSVIFYLEPLLPVEVPAKEITALFAIPADPISGFVAVPGLFLVTAAILLFACWRVRETEINYSVD